MVHILCTMTSVTSRPLQFWILLFSGTSVATLIEDLRAAFEIQSGAFLRRTWSHLNISQLGNCFLLLPLGEEPAITMIHPFLRVYRLIQWFFDMNQSREVA